jgi:hypothetical protein
MKLFIQSTLVVLALSAAAVAVPNAQAQDSPTAPPAQGQTLTPEQKGKAAEVEKILNEDQKKQLQSGLAEGKEMKDIIPTLGLSRGQKMELMKLKKQ